MKNFIRPGTLSALFCAGFIMIWNSAFAEASLLGAWEEGNFVQYDVDKYVYTTGSIPYGVDTELSDSNMCWAASSANILTYGGWAIPSGSIKLNYATEYDVYHELLGAFPNAGGFLKTAAEAYVNWHYPEVDLNNYYQRYDTRELTANVPEIIAASIDAQVPVSLGVYRYYEDEQLTGHALTVWGYEEVNGPNVNIGPESNPLYEQYVMDLYITDSNDYREGITLQKYPVYRYEGMPIEEQDGYHLRHYLGSVTSFLLIDLIEIFEPWSLPLGYYYYSPFDGATLVPVDQVTTDDGTVYDKIFDDLYIRIDDVPDEEKFYTNPMAPRPWPSIVWFDKLKILEKIYPKDTPLAGVDYQALVADETFVLPGPNFQTTAVPEPSALLLFAGGLFGLPFMRKKGEN